MMTNNIFEGINVSNTVKPPRRRQFGSNIKTSHSVPCWEVSLLGGQMYYFYYQRKFLVF